MGNTNQELANQLKKLEQEFERFTQNLEPKSGYYEGQTWYDKNNQLLNTWDGKEWKPLGGTSLFFTDYQVISSTSDKTINCGFKPKHVYLECIRIVLDSSISRSWTVENEDETISVTTQFAEIATMETLGSGDSTSIDAVYIVDGGNISKAKISYTNTGFVLSNINLSAGNVGVHIRAIG